ncbi:MAG: hypothetical protein IPM17_05730 [Verrucomicrobia bacterium]|nr:hypothetical protein [Verrucomicrobiota bacterium]
MRKLNLNSLQHHRLLELAPALVAIILALEAPLAPLAAASPAKPGSPPAVTDPGNRSIPWSDLGAPATAQYSGDGLAVWAGPNRVVHLRCAFQRLEGEVTPEGLWLTSTVEGVPPTRFGVVADYLGRDGGAMVALPERGMPACEVGLARYARRGLVEEYSVSVDGVRQDFVVSESPGGAGPLRVDLVVIGAKTEPLAQGARLVLDGSGRKLAYSRLRVVDANERQLSARLEVVFENRMAVVVEDAGAVYPVRIDPTFTDENWVSMGALPGTDGDVNAAVVDASGNLYIGGKFTIVGDVLARNVVKWNGRAWSALGSGVDGPVLAMAVSGTDVYVGGEFATAGGVTAVNIAKWNGSVWSALDSGVSRGGSPGRGGVYALTASGTDLYAGGSFDTAGGTTASNIAKWNGSGWVALGPGTDRSVRALAVSGADLYVGGDFYLAGGTAANKIAKWNGSSWSALGSWDGGDVYALAVSGMTVYVGRGLWRDNNIAVWDGSSWSALGSGMDGPVYSLAVSGTDVYAGGLFNKTGWGSANCIAKWDGSTWSALGSGIGGAVRAIVAVGTNVYVGGEFTLAGTMEAWDIAKWDGIAWSALCSGTGGLVRFPQALAVSGADLYVGGQFTTVGQTAATNIAKWNGSGWSALGSGVSKPGWSSEVLALAASGSNLYVGGTFSRAGEAYVNNVARWNGSTWSALGSGFVGARVVALAVSGTELYAAADNYGICKWDGNRWTQLGDVSRDGWPGDVMALAGSGGDLYIGGSFTTVGQTAAKNIAKWNGSGWSALGDGVDGTVHALAVSGTDLFAGGEFSMAGTVNAKCIAKWNGNTWSSIGSIGGGRDDYVLALAVYGTDLYAGGSFTRAGGTAANRIAKWDGNTWSPLGSGVNDPVTALAVSGTDLYAGGYFTTAGGKVSAYLAKAVLGLGPGAGLARTITVSKATPTIVFQGTPGSPYDVQRTISLSPPVTWATLTPTGPLMPGADGLFSFTDTNAPPGTAYYRSGPR